MRHGTLSAFAVLACLAALSAPVAARANSNGFFNPGAQGCNNCHSGGSAPVVTVSANPTVIAPNETTPLTVTITTPSGTGAGFNLRATGGTFSNPGPGAFILTGQVTHTTPKAEDAQGLVTFTAQWRAAAPGTYSFTAWGNSVNRNGSTTGDRSASGTTQVTVCTPQTFYADADGDGFGDPSNTISACAAPMGFVSNGDDCDDTTATRAPGAMELCNGLDDDCDGQIDEGLMLQTFFPDADGDGFGGDADTVQACAAPPGYLTTGGDCDDGNAAVHPDAIEVCNGLDDNCDGSVDEGLPMQTLYVDEDGDGFGGSVTVQRCGEMAGYVATPGDCDDTRGDIHPNAMETCDGVDENCNGMADEGVPMARCGLGICQRTGSTCHPSSCTPGVRGIETCNGLDDDCNGFIDDDPEALCPGTNVCTAQSDGGAECLPPEETPDGGEEPADGGVNTDGRDGLGEETVGCGCAAGGRDGGGLRVLLFLLGLGALIYTARRKKNRMRKDPRGRDV